MTATASALPWMHDQLVQLATALGVSTRTLDTWRTRGAPLTGDGPHDELAVRLWHIGMTRAGGKRGAKLSDPGEQLAPYLAVAAKLLDGAPPPVTDAAVQSAIKRATAEKIGLHNARARGELIEQAQGVFARAVGMLEAALLRDLGAKAGRVWERCHARARADAEHDVLILLRTAVTDTVADVLAQLEHQQQGQRAGKGIR